MRVLRYVKHATGKCTQNLGVICNRNFPQLNQLPGKSEQSQWLRARDKLQTVPTIGVKQILLALMGGQASPALTLRLFKQHTQFAAAVYVAVRVCSSAKTQGAARLPKQVPELLGAL